MWNFSSSVQLDVRSERERYRVEHEKRIEFHISEQPCIYFGYYINVLLTRGSRLNSGLKNLFVALNRARDMSAADWPSQTHVKYF